MTTWKLRRSALAAACCVALTACSEEAEPGSSPVTTTQGTGATSTATTTSTSTVTDGSASVTQSATGPQASSTLSTTSTESATSTSSGLSATSTATSGSTTATGTGAGGASASTTGAETSADGAGGTGGLDPVTFAAGLDGLFIDVPCQAPTPTPLPDEATCDHPSGTQHIEENVVFGGDSATVYLLTLRVRGIWEPTFISGGNAPDAALPFKIGGQVAAGNAIDYQQFYITVSEPAETYWLNDYQYTAHDIHKADYEIAIPVAGGASVTVVMNDGNERQIANYPGELFDDLPPYDETPTTGQLLRLDVVSVSEQ